MRKILAVKLILGFVIIFTTTVIILLLTKTIAPIDNLPSPDYRIKGNKNAKIMIIEYTDLNCPACANMNNYLNDLIKYFPNDFQVHFKHYPLERIHPYSLKAAVWVECAGVEENKFFELADIFFKNQKEWWNNKDYINLFEKYTKEANIDVKKIRDCFNSSKTLESVKKDIERGDKLGIDSTPTFFVNGQMAVGGMELIEILKKEKSK
jgi:protein-disulfide isomerase